MSTTPSDVVRTDLFASPWKRYLAGFIDCFLLYLVFRELYPPIWWFTVQTEPFFWSEKSYLLRVGLFFVFFAIYKTVSYLCFSATPGQLLLRLKVISLTGQRISLNQSIRRSGVELGFVVLAIIAMLLFGYSHYQRHYSEASRFMSATDFWRNPSIMVHAFTGFMFDILPNVWFFLNSATILSVKRRSIRDRLGKTCVVDARKTIELTIADQ